MTSVHGPSEKIRTSKVDLHARLAQPRMLTNIINIVHIDCFEMGIIMVFIYISFCIDVVF